MHRVRSRALLLGGLVGFLAACGEVPGGASGISGTVTAPAGGSVMATDVFACFNNETDCARLGEATIAQEGLSAAYRLSGLLSGSYGVYAFKDNDGDNEVDNGELFGFYGSAPGTPQLVTPPAVNVDITMTRLTGVTSAPLRDSITKIISND